MEKLISGRQEMYVYVRTICIYAVEAVRDAELLRDLHWRKLTAPHAQTGTVTTCAQQLKTVGRCK